MRGAIRVSASRGWFRRALIETTRNAFDAHPPIRLFEAAMRDRYLYLNT